MHVDTQVRGIRLKVEAEKSKVLIEVSDTGVGIDQDLVDQTINQLESSNFQEIDTFSTLGLGIVGVHNFCKRIGATFICKSQANKGTVIKIHHPVLLKAKTDTLNKVTIVSNNEPNVKNIQASVQKIKWQCDITEDIEGIANEQPRLAIIDIDHTPKPFKVISSLITSQKKCDFILLLMVSLLMFLWFYLVMIQIFIKPSCVSKKHASAIYLQGLSKPIENKVRDIFKESIFYKTFSYSQSITLRIISGEFYKVMQKNPLF